MAAISGNLALVYYIHSKLGVNKQNNVFSSAFISAAYNGHLDVVRYFFENSKKKAPKAMAIAASAGHKDIVNYLLMNKVSPNGVSDSGKSALILAIENENKEIIDLLIEYNVNINQCDDDDVTPLMYASYIGNIEIVKTLLDNKASIDAIDSMDRNALIHAVIAGNIDIVELLLLNGMSLNSNKESITPLMWAVIYDNLKSVKYLIEKNVDIEESDVNGWNAFMFACAKGYMNIVKYILDLYPDIINKKSKSKETALMIASDNGRFDVVEYLLDNNASIKDQNINGDTALYIAS